MTQFEMLDFLEQTYPDWLTSEEISQRTGTAISSTRKIMQKLRKFGMCEAKRRVREGYPCAGCTYEYRHRIGK